jgi:hypothetical protein
MLSSLAAAPWEAASLAGTAMTEQVASCPNGGILIILQADLESVGTTGHTVAGATAIRQREQRRHQLLNGAALWPN